MSDQTTIADVVQGVKELRAEFEKSSPNLAKVELIEKALEKHEEKNQALVMEMKAREKREEELKERLDAMEVELARKSQAGGKQYKDTAEYKALAAYVKRGDFAIAATEQKAILRTDNDVQGGFLVLPEMDNMITKEITEISPIRSIARVRTTSSKTLAMVIRDSIPTATFEGEAEEGGESNSTYKSENVTAYRQTVTVPVTQDLLMNSEFSMESEIMTDAGEGFAQGEGAGFVTGTGVKSPEGFTVNATLVADARESAGSAAISYNDMVDLSADLKQGYNPVYVFNRATLAYLRKLIDGSGRPLWLPGLNGVVANTINGYPYVIANDMPDVASNAIAVAFGDFRRGYVILDRTGLAIVRDDISQKKKAIVEFTLHRWLTGQVVLTEAIKLLKLKA